MDTSIPTPYIPPDDPLVNFQHLQDKLQAYNIQDKLTAGINKIKPIIKTNMINPIKDIMDNTAAVDGTVLHQPVTYVTIFNQKT